MSALFDLSGRVAIVTGASRGIGAAIARRLAEHGARVVVAARKLEACREVAAAINAEVGGEAAIPVAADIGDKASLQAMAARCTDAFGAADILVCNAASNPHLGGLSTIPDEAFAKTLRNNVIANNWLVQLTAPEMIRRRRGSIIMVSSIGAFRGTAVAGAYAISKAADLQMVRNLAMELGPHNVRVNAIAPGLVRTQFARPLWEDPRTLAQLTEGTCLGRIGESDEIAGAAVFLACDAATFVTGQTLVVDGGALAV